MKNSSDYAMYINLHL